MQPAQSVTLTILQALYGDALCIRFLGSDAKHHNIFVDGGLANTYSRTVKREVLRVAESGEMIDLFVITHTDQDHIGGLLKFIKEFGSSNLVREYWFNSSDADPKLLSAHESISIGEGIRLRDFLQAVGKKTGSTITTAVVDVDLHGARIDVLSPTQDDLDQYQENWRIEEEKMRRWRKLAAEGNDYRNTIAQLASNTFTEDESLNNRASIALCLRVSGRTLMLLGDSHPSTITSSLNHMGYSNTIRLRVDATKLAHHASKFSTSNDLLSLIDCSNFIISANGKNRYHFPQKETLARVLCHPGRDLNKHIRLIFNYDNDVIRSIFSTQEQDRYNFSCEFPEGDANGYVFRC